MNITIIGAGKTGRGFIARLLNSENVNFTFIDKDKELIDKLSTNNYQISYFNDTIKNIIDGYEAYLSYSEMATNSIAKADYIFISVGINNFKDVANQLLKGSIQRIKSTPFCVITCENAVNPGRKLLTSYLNIGGAKNDMIIGESAIFCTTIEDLPDRLNILSENYSLLPTSEISKFNETTFKFVNIIKDFDLLLKRKIFTYNSSSAIIGYLGWYKGYKYYADAANDKTINLLLDQEYEKINSAIVTEFKVPEKVQNDFSIMAKKKFQNKYIKDSVERNIRGASRKLGGDERIIGPMELLLKNHTFSIALALTAAIAFKYGIENEREMQNDFEKVGIDGMLLTYSSLDKNCKLAELIKENFIKIQSNISIEDILLDVKVPKILIFGCGKIARGFIGHILWKAERTFKFVDKNENLVNLVNEKKSYPVRILGKEIKLERVKGVSAWSYADIDKIKEAVATVIDTIFISVGGKNLPHLKDLLKEVLWFRFEKQNKSYLNIILCENWIKPADIIRDMLYENSSEDFVSYINKYVGITESAILRSGIEPSKEILEKEPLAVNVQDYWNFWVDSKRLKTRLPTFPCLNYLDNFNGFLAEKFYTYNAANGCVSYLGNLKGYKYIYDAATDPEILEILKGVYNETSVALCKKLGLDSKKHYEFTLTSLKKLQNKYLVDYVERNARDPIRKLGPNDRLIGPALFVIETHGIPDALSTVIAAAIFYENPDDIISQQLVKMRKEKGINYILDEVCMISDQIDLKNLIIKKIDMLKKRNWIKENLEENENEK